MDELKALLASGHILALRQVGEVVEIVTAHTDGNDTQSLRSAVIIGLDPDLDYEVTPCVGPTLEDALRGAAAMAGVRC